MEPYKQISEKEKFRPNLNDGPGPYFKKALSFAREFYQEEMDFISSIRFEDVAPGAFFREYIWVVHATGFSAKAVGKFMPRLEEAYGYWLDLGLKEFDDAFVPVKPVCNNPQKAKAIHSMARMMGRELGQNKIAWSDFRQERLSTPEKLAKLPYIGKVTCYHLGRNIGLLECVKPDLHLLRMAEHWGFQTCEEMCRAVRPEGMPLGIVDLVFWYAASTFGTLEIRQEGSR